MIDQAGIAKRVALVTGGARGFGRAICERLARDGYRVLVADLCREGAEATATAINTVGGEAFAISADISDEGQVLAMFEAAAEHGGVDVLVNNAGFMRTTAPAATIPLAEWEMTFAINTRGPFLCMKAALPNMVEKGHGRIVNISSSAGRQTSTFCGAHYTASKAAVLGLTRHAAREYARYGITINAVAPGTFLTDGAREGMAAEGITEDMLGPIRQACPTQRFGEPHEVADLVAFLVSDHAAYITGATVDINGGDLMM